MNKRMSRILMTLSLMTIPVVAFASTGRIAGLGVSTDYVKDFTGTRTYLSGVTAVGNLVWVNPSDNAGMGAVLQNLWDGRFGTFAVNINNTAMGLGASTAGDVNTSGESVDLTWGHKMGDGSLGVRVNRSFESTEVPGNPVVEGNGTLSRNINGIGVGYGWPMNDNADVELSALYQNRTFDNGAGLTEDGGAAWQVAGRAMMKAGGNLMLVPVVKLRSFDLSTITAGAPAVTTTDKRTSWAAGLAGNWTVGSDDLFILGAEFSNSTVDNGTNKSKDSSMPAVFMALEGGVNSWLTLRFGAGNTLFNRGEDFAGVVTKTNTFNSFMGAGVKLGSFMMDASVAPTFWNGAVNDVLNGAPFANVSATYSF